MSLSGAGGILPVFDLQTLRVPVASQVRKAERIPLVAAHDVKGTLSGDTRACWDLRCWGSGPGLAAARGLAFRGLGGLCDAVDCCLSGTDVDALGAQARTAQAGTAAKLGNCAILNHPGSRYTHTLPLSQARARCEQPEPGCWPGTCP